MLKNRWNFGIKSINTAKQNKIENREFLVLVLLYSIFDVLYSLFKLESKYVLSAHQNIILPFFLFLKFYSTKSVTFV